MDIKKNIREQLKELSSSELTDIMCAYFADGANSWQSDILWTLMEDDETRCAAEGFMINKIVDEVDVDELVEDSVIEHPLQDIIDEFLELKSSIEAMLYDEVMDTYCMLCKSDGEIELDVSDDVGNIVAVYIEVCDLGAVSVDADNVTIKGEYGQNEVVDLSKYVNR